MKIYLPKTANLGRSHRKNRRTRAITAAIEPLEPRQLFSTIVYVDSASTGANNGTTWVNAYTNLQTALTAAVSGQTIEVSQGTYFPTNSNDRTADFQLIDGVAIQGGYAGVNTPLPNALDPTLFPTILSGDIAQSGNITDNSYHVVRGDGTNSSAVLAGVTITGGNANGTSGDSVGGGGMYTDAGTPTVIDCTFISNFGYFGGAIWNNSSPIGINPGATFTDCMFINNSAGYPVGSAGTGGGGAIFNEFVAPTITNCAFNNNWSTNNGGAIEEISCRSIIDNCTFTNNTALLGSAIADDPTTGTTVTNSILWGDNGSEITDSAGSISVTYCDVQGAFTGTGNINTNPLFVSAATNLLDLQPHSPCVNAGKNSLVPSGILTDLAGNPRISAGIVDMGAYELPGGAMNLVATLIPSNAVAGSTSSAKIVIAFEDQSGNVITADDNDITLSILNGPDGGVLGGTVTVQAQNGVATFTNLQLNTAGVYTLTAASNGIPSANLPAFTVTSGGVGAVAIAPLPANISAGTNFSPGISVNITDGFGNPATGTVVLSILSGPTGSVLTGTTTATAKNGLAIFTKLSLRSAGTYTLKATSGAISVDSTSITVTPASQLKVSFFEQPSSVQAGTPISLPLLVQVTDKYGNLLTTSNADVTLSLKSAPKGASLAGVTSVALDNGMATFNNLDLTVAGSYTLTASFAGATSANSSKLTITPAAASALSIAQQPTGGKAGSSVKPPLTVDIKDQFGNLINTSSTVTVSIFSSTSGGALSGTVSVTTTSGIATFKSLIFSMSGTYVLTISDNGLASLHSGNIVVT